MNSVVFANAGLLDVRCITTFGVSAKVNDNPIGQFGTGLKYAIAVILRHGLEIEIQIGGVNYVFNTRPENIRGQDFDFIYMTAINTNLLPDEVGDSVTTQLSFTTDLGKKWELWMAFRELYSNCIDEKGQVFLGEEDAITCDETVIMVTGEEFVKIFEEKANVFIEEGANKTIGNLNIHDGDSKYVYNRGIRIAEFEKPLLASYDIQGSVELTEDRTLKHEYYFNNKLTSAVTSTDDEEFIEKVVTASKDYHEASLNFNGSTPSDTFLAVVKRLIKRGKDKINPTVVRVYETVVKASRSKTKKTRIYIDLDVGLNTDENEVVRIVGKALAAYTDILAGEGVVEDSIEVNLE